MNSTILVFAVVVGCAFAAVPPVKNLVKTLNAPDADPKKVCSEIGACNAMVEEAHLKPTIFGLKCSACELVVPFAEKEVAGEGPTAQKDLDKLCKKFGFFDHECEKLVNEYLPKIVAALKAGKGADTVCRDLGFCSALEEIKISQSANIVECDICKALGPEIELLLAKEGTVVEKDLDNICKKLPIHLLDKPCESFINSKMDRIIAELNNDENQNAHDFCQAVDACKRTVAADFVAKMKAARHAARVQLKNALECFVCHAVGPRLEDLAKKEEPVVVKDLEEVCKVAHFIPGEQKVCDDWIEKEGALIVKVLNEDESHDARVLCSKLGMC